MTEEGISKFVPVLVPSVVGQTAASASAAILGAGLVVGAVSKRSSSTVPVGNVISQDPLGGVSLEAGFASSYRRIDRAGSGEVRY